MSNKQSQSPSLKTIKSTHTSFSKGVLLDHGDCNNIGINDAFEAHFFVFSDFREVKKNESITVIVLTPLKVA